MRPLPPSCRPQRLIERTFGPEFSQTLRNLPIRFNIAPTKSVPFIRNAVGRELQNPAAARELVLVRWSLIPSWAKDPAIGSRMINARAKGQPRMIWMKW